MLRLKFSASAVVILRWFRGQRVPSMASMLDRLEKLNERLGYVR